MKERLTGLAVLVVILLVLMPFVSGCMTIPGPESRPRFTAETTTVPVPTHTIKPTAGAVQKTLVVTPAPVTSPPTAIPVTAAGVYETESCTGQGGFIVTPGFTCTGAWLGAADTFSCCQVPPVPAGNGNATVVATPFNLAVSLDDGQPPLIP